MEQSIPMMEGRLEEVTRLMERNQAIQPENRNDDDDKSFDSLYEEAETLARTIETERRNEKARRVADLKRRIDRGEVEMVRGDASQTMRDIGDLDDDPFAEPRSADREFRGRNPFNLDEIRTMGRSPGEIGSELKARAISAVAHMPGANDTVRSTIVDIIEKWDNPRGDIARLTLTTGSPAYMRAFQKVMAGNGQLTEEESRAMSTTTTAGGFLIPQQLDPTVIITSAGSLNQIRQAARTVVATGNVWYGVSAGETSWSFDAEAAEVSDDASTFAQPSITVRKAQGFVPISIEALEDEANVTAEVGRLLASGKETLEATAFITGAAGSNEPIGIITALTAATTYLVSSTTTDTFGSPDVYALDDALPARWRVNASWLAHRSIYNDVRQFDANGGAQLWERIGNDMPPNLLGRPAYEAEAMDSTISTTEDYILVYGDFDNYVIADRVGMRVEPINHLFGSNQRPTGSRGWYAYYRVGADSVNDAAFRVLNAT